MQDNNKITNNILDLINKVYIEKRSDSVLKQTDDLLIDILDGMSPIQLDNLKERLSNTYSYILELKEVNIDLGLALVIRENSKELLSEIKSIKNIEKSRFICDCLDIDEGHALLGIGLYLDNGISLDIRNLNIEMQGEEALEEICTSIFYKENSFIYDATTLGKIAKKLSSYENNKYELESELYEAEDWANIFEALSTIIIEKRLQKNGCLSENDKVLNSILHDIPKTMIEIGIRLDVLGRDDWNNIMGILRTLATSDKPDNQDLMEELLQQANALYKKVNKFEEAWQEYCREENDWN
jgi:hypothetical protein